MRLIYWLGIIAACGIGVFVVGRVVRWARVRRVKARFTYITVGSGTSIERKIYRTRPATKITLMPIESVDTITYTDVRGE